MLKRKKQIIHFPPLGQCDLQMILAYQVDQASCLDTLTEQGWCNNSGAAGRGVGGEVHFY